MKIWLSLINKTTNKGFTLLELLLASFMTFFVVSATGYAVIVMLQQNLVGEVSSDTQSNLNRAMDFIADEAKSASSIYTSASAATGALVTSPSSPGVGAQAILGLNINGAQPIIYYLVPKQNDDVWLGPNIIHRWGPTLDSTGNYVDKDDETTWSYDVLVDAIADSSYYIRNESGVDKRIALTGIKEVGPDQAAATDNINKCPAGGASSDIASGWTAIPGIVPGTTTYFGEKTGFYVCVSNDGRQAEIHAYASLAQELDNRGIADSSNLDNRNADKVSYGVVSFVYPRSTSGVAAGGGTTALSITEPAKVSLSAGSGCSTDPDVNINGTTTSLSSFTPTTVYPSYSPVLSISGFSYDDDAGSGNAGSTDNIAAFVNGGCTITLTLNTP